jgi:hypothetical protein
MSGRHNSKKQSPKKSSRSTKNRKFKQVRPRTLQQFRTLSSRKQDEVIRATQVVSIMRAGDLSLTGAAEQLSIPPKKVLQLTGNTLTKQKNGRYRARKTDNLLRVLVVPSEGGLTEVAVRTSSEASIIAKYNDAVQKFLRTGDESKLSQFRSKEVKDSSGRPIAFLTDTKELTRLGSAGVFSFESLYARSAR